MLCTKKKKCFFTFLTIIFKVGFTKDWRFRCCMVSSEKADFREKGQDYIIPDG